MSDLGRDLSCVADMDPAGAEVSGRRALSEAIARRLTTPRGRLIDDGNYGFDLKQYLDADLAPSDLAQIKANAEAECVKDERVLSATITLQLLVTGLLLVTVALQDATGSFTLVLSISQIAATLLTVSS